MNIIFAAAAMRFYATFTVATRLISFSFLLTGADVKETFLFIEWKSC